MANSKLLKEAIADAKAVKETALANAKIALEEAFTPRLQSILSKKLREEMQDDEEDVNEELDSSDIGGGPKSANDSPKNPKGFDADTDLSVGVKKSSAAPGAEGEETKVADINEEEDVETETDENLSVAKLRERLMKRLAELDAAETPAEEPAAETEKEGWMHEDEPEGDDDSMDFGDDEDGDEEYEITGEEEEDTEEDDMDLEAIIRELEASVGADEEPKNEEEETPSDEMDEDALSSGDPAGTDKGEDPKVVMAEEEDEEEKPKAEGKDVTRASGQAPRGSFDINEEDNEDGEIDLEEILREMEADLKGEEKPKEESKQVKEMKKSLKEAYDTITSLRKTINEVNLLNAKLLFANKLFRAHNLTNEQKVKVIETLDRTGSIREVKLVYSTLAENLKFGSSQKVAKKSITEGIASKVVKSTKPAAKQVISEGADFSARFKKLAGIIK